MEVAMEFLKVAVVDRKKELEDVVDQIEKFEAILVRLKQQKKQLESEILGLNAGYEKLSA